jgi:type I restriction enzyme S subunit
MIDGLRPYSEMKPSGLTWLGDVPAHWDVGRAGRFLSRIEQGWSPVAAEGALDIDQWAVLSLSAVRHGTFVPTAIKPVSRSARVPSNLELKNGDFLLTRSNTRSKVGDVCVVDHVRPKTFMSDLIYRLALKETAMDTSFMMYQLLSNFGRWQIERDARGSSDSMPKIGQRHIKDWSVVAPPLDEQRLIVRFLDWHGAHAAKLIRAKKKLIALLNEQKQAIIHRAVTRGLDSDVELKPSGIPWIGDIPIGWETTRIKNIARLQSGESITAFEIEEIGPFPVFGGNGLRGYTSRFTHDGNYVLIGRQGALCGNINYASGQFFASEHAVVVHPRTKLSTRWFGELLRIMNLNQYSIAAAQPGLSVERIANLQIPLPASQEQECIIQAVDHEICGLDRAIGYVGQEQALVQEFRARLVADVVSGKLDVRAAAASLPETTDVEISDETIEPDEFAETDDLENEEAAA